MDELVHWVPNLLFGYGWWWSAGWSLAGLGGVFACGWWARPWCGAVAAWVRRDRAARRAARHRGVPATVSRYVPDRELWQRVVQRLQQVLLRSWARR